MLPLFPLELVLLPSDHLPLHIFEERYKEMIAEAIRDQTEFGVVQASEQGILNIGCTATVEEIVKEYPDGRMDILTVGRRRFEVLFLDETKPYLRAAVSFFADEELADAADEAKTMAMACFELLRRQQNLDCDLPAKEDPQLSFKISAHVPDLSFRQTVLALRSEAGRIAYINQYLPEYLANLKRAAHVRKVAGRNGHGFIAIGRKPE